MEQGSEIFEEEATEEMTITEVTRLNDWLKAMGLSDSEILDCQKYIATGVGLPVKEPAEVKDSN